MAINPDGDLELKCLRCNIYYYGHTGNSYVHRSVTFGFMLANKIGNKFLCHRCGGELK